MSESSNNNIVIEARSLTKVFGKITAVDRLDLAVARGELYGLVGPDGAGKTTIMRLLASVMLPTSGQASVAGFSPIDQPERVKEKIGYMSQRFGLYEDLTVIENIDFYADLYEVPKKERPSRIERLLGFSNLTPFKKRLAGRLSGGMKQKLGLACALVHTPEVLFLDEPTNGVDPVSRRDFWRILYDLLREKITIFLSTAYLDEAERCTRVGLIHKGRLLMEGDPSRIKASLGTPMFELWPDNPRRAARILSEIAAAQSVSVYGDRIHAAFASRDLADNAMAVLESHGVKVEAFRETVPSLEDVFIAMVSADE
jgi:ABC-2 type transport system ATP-binding protein